jgi:peroxiredoxin family protein
MENKKMCMALFSGSLDKLTAAGVILSGAVADDMDVDIYVLMQGARAFKREIAEDKDKLMMAENSHLREEFIAACKQLNVKEWYLFFIDAKAMANVKVHICGLAGKLWGGTKIDDFVEWADDICGINEYITSAQNADVHLFI